MNNDKMKTLIATVKDAYARGKFDITKWVHHCGTPACIAGYAAYLNNGESNPKSYYSMNSLFRLGAFYENELMIFLDITSTQSKELSSGFQTFGFEPTLDETIEFMEAFALNPDYTWSDAYE